MHQFVPLRSTHIARVPRSALLWSQNRHHIAILTMQTSEIVGDIARPAPKFRHHPDKVRRHLLRSEV